MRPDTVYGRQRHNDPGAFECVRIFLFLHPAQDISPECVSPGRSQEPTIT